MPLRPLFQWLFSLLFTTFKRSPYVYSSTLALNNEHSLYIITNTIVKNHCTPYSKLGADTKSSDVKECRIEEEEEESSPSDPALCHGCNFLPGAHPSSSLPTPRLSARCFLAVIFSSVLGDSMSVLALMLDVGFLSVWPIQCHFLRFFSVSIGCWFVLVHKVLLLTLSDHFTFMILRNLCILFTLCLVILHVSELYNITDLTL